MTISKDITNVQRKYGIGNRIAVPGKNIVEIGAELKRRGFKPWGKVIEVSGTKNTMYQFKNKKGKLACATFTPRGKTVAAQDFSKL
jgi:hypothetical protein